MSVHPSVGPSVHRSVTLSHFGLLGASYGRVSGLVKNEDGFDKKLNEEITFLSKFHIHPSLPQKAALADWKKVKKSG